jgi:hypothetical protein
MAVSNNLLAGTLAGVAGAVSVNLMHEITRQITPKAPRMDLVGMRAVARITDALDAPRPDNLRTATFVGDVVANSLYYSLVAAAGPREALAAGAILGAAAGFGGVLLPPPMGLGDEEVNRTPATQVLTVGMYLAGGLIAALTYRLVAKNR